MRMAGPFHPPFSFCTAAKRERAVDGPREKTPRRVGPHICVPPAAGGGWLALPCRSQGRKRPALGETSGPGKNRDTLSLPPRCRLRSREEQPAAAKIDAGPCVSHPDEVGTIRHGTAVPKVAGEYSVPEGRPKSGQAPIRRPPCARRATAPECAQRFSLWTVHGPFLFWQDKREMGGASWLDKPPWREPVPRGRRPAAHLSPGGRLPPLRRLPGADFSKSV